MMARFKLRGFGELHALWDMLADSHRETIGVTSPRDSSILPNFRSFAVIQITAAQEDIRTIH